MIFSKQKSLIVVPVKYDQNVSDITGIHHMLDWKSIRNDQVTAGGEDNNQGLLVLLGAAKKAVWGLCLTLVWRQPWLLAQ